MSGLRTDHRVSGLSSPVSLRFIWEPGCFHLVTTSFTHNQNDWFLLNIATLNLNWGEFKCVMLQLRPKMILFQFPKIRTLDTIYKLSWFMFSKFIEG